MRRWGSSGKFSISSFPPPTDMHRVTDMPHIFSHEFKWTEAILHLQLRNSDLSVIPTKTQQGGKDIITSRQACLKIPTVSMTPAGLEPRTAQFTARSLHYWLLLLPPPPWKCSYSASQHALPVKRCHNHESEPLTQQHQRNATTTHRAYVPLAGKPPHKCTSSSQPSLQSSIILSSIPSF